MNLAVIGWATIAIAGLLLMTGSSVEAFAQQKDHPSFQVVVGKNADKWEVQVGGAFFDTGIFSSQKLDGGVIDFELLSPSPGFLSGIGSPRPYVGADIAISDSPIDAFFAGLNWQAYLTKRFYTGFSLGGAIMTRDKATNAFGEEKNLGCSTLFHLQASVGYDITDNLGVETYYNHFSNAKLCTPDQGLESVGARLAVRF